MGRLVKPYMAACFRDAPALPLGAVHIESYLAKNDDEHEPLGVMARMFLGRLFTTFPLLGRYAEFREMEGKPAVGAWGFWGGLALITEDCTLVNRIEDPSLADDLVTVPIAAWAAVDVEPGGWIEFANDVGLWIGSATGEGSLNAAGTEAEPVFLAAETPADRPTWLGIGFGSSSVDNRLEFVTVEHGGNAPVDGMLDVKAGVTFWDS